MTISEYHNIQKSIPEEEYNKRTEAKKGELSTIIKQAEFQSNKDILKIGVLGCGDSRSIEDYISIFENITGKVIDLTVFDITTEHLNSDKAKIIEHDCTKVLPNGPFDITLGHVVLKFVEQNSQSDLVMNSYHALYKGGIAIHILDRKDYEEMDGKIEVDLDKIISRLNSKKIIYELVDIKYGIGLVLFKI